MKSSKIVFNAILLAVAFGAIVTDKIVVSASTEAVQATCETQVSFDQTGNPYCVQPTIKNVNVAQK